MSKVAVVTGASQGIGAATVAAYRKLGYLVVANSRRITPPDDPGVLAVPGDIADPAVGARVIEAGLNEYATRGIRFNAVSPGVIRTPMHPAETHEFLAGLHPMARLGEILHVDGGQSAGH
ncbi:hypothetical protein AB0F81_07975 [Actinoplanes sp. NPDC024001]|uniref:hypothetical protein n=1 Tax=Actinoplanes sp. NPDC024001 TaxID=3154598 RepID=UPI0033E7F3C5